MSRYGILLEEDTKPEPEPRKPTKAVTRPPVRQARVAPQVDKVESPPLEQKEKNTNGHINHPSVLKIVRPFAQRTFNLYDDQIEYLTRVSLEQRLAGRDVSMNDMVREALDIYMTQKTSKK